MNSTVTSATGSLETLLERVASGDREAFLQLYDATSARLLGVLLPILKRRAVAEEALQECYLRIWRHAGRYDPERSEAFVWMTGIVRNHALDILRRRRNREDRELSWSPLDDETLGGDTPSPELALADSEILARCLSRLADKPRECVLRAYCEGRSHDELSAALDTPVGTVKSWIRRSLGTLRECIRELS